MQWMHQKPGGNSGVFVWASQESITNLHEGKHNKRLPDGIEVQILDHAFRDNYIKKTGNRRICFSRPTAMCLEPGRVSQV